MNLLTHKKYIYPAIALVILAGGAISAVIGYQEYILPENDTSENHSSRMNSRHHEEMNEIETNDDMANIQRSATNTASGVEIILSTTDTGSLSRISAEFEIMKGSAEFQNTAFSITGSKISNSFKISLSSNNPDIIKLIQEKASSGESGIYGIELTKEKKDEKDSNGENRKEKRGHDGEKRDRSNDESR